mmetsp:Transcript_92674/g.212254  ORF Transcript_92674/g.212254 Transcript_92674/m.212254 type:complete len:365 (+) Transcript_92674:256-1350(+)
MAPVFVSGKPEIVRWSNSDCLAARMVSSSPASAASLHACCSLASVTSSVSASRFTPKSTVFRNAGISNTAPVSPGQFFIDLTRVRTASKYSEPSSSFWQVSSVSLVTWSNLLRADSRSCNFSFSFTSSICAFLTVSMRSDRSVFSGGISVARSSSTASSHEVSWQAAPVSSTRSSMTRKLFLHCSSSAARSSSHCSGENVTVSSNFLSLSAAPVASWASIVVGATVVVAGSCSNCRAANFRWPVFAMHACTAREAVTKRRAAREALLDDTTPSSSNCREVLFLEACFITLWNMEMGVTGELPSSCNSFNSALYISNCRHASAFASAHSFNRCSYSACFLLMRSSKSLMIASSAVISSTKVVSTL